VYRPHAGFFQRFLVPRFTAKPMNFPLRHALCRPRRLARFAAGIAVCLSVLAGCDGGLSGTFEDAESRSSIEFKPDGQCYLTILGGTVQGDYEIDGDKVIVRTNGQNMVLTRHGDQLEGGPLGMKFTRRSAT